MIIKTNFIVGLALMLLKISSIKAQDRKEFSTEDLISAIKNNNYSAVSGLFNDVAIGANNPKNFNELIEQALKLQFDKLNLQMLVKYFETHDNKEERLFGYSAVFDEMKSRDKLNETALVTLAFGLRDLSRENVTSDAKEKINQLKDFLPKSVRNLAFANKICLRNFEYKEYLYAASDGFKYDNDRRRVFTWVPGGRVGQGEWVVERANEGYYVKNINHNEYLYAAVDYFNYLWPRLPGRRMFTWVPGGNPGDDRQFQWEIEPMGGQIRLTNINYNEALQIHEKYDSDRRELTSRKDFYLDSIWDVDDC